MNSVNTSQPQPPTYTKITLTNAPAIITVSVAVTTIISIIRDLAYFYTIDSLHFFTLMSINDHLSSLASWLPWSALSYVIGTLYANLPPSLSEPQKSKHNRYFGILLILSFALVVVSLFFTASKFEFVAMLILFITLLLYELFCTTIFGEIFYILPTLSTHLRWPVVIATVLVLAAISAGAGQGIADLKAPTAANFVRLHDGSLLTDITILMSLERGTLLRTSYDNRIVFLPWRQIAEESLQGPDPTGSTPACSWLHITCSGPSLSR